MWIESHNKYKDVLLNSKFIKHLMSRIQSKGYRLGTHETNKISLSWFDEKYIQNNWYTGLALGYYS